VTILGKVCQEADVSYNNRRLTICTPEKILVTTNLFPVYDYGDNLRIRGELQAPAAFSEFDYPAYLARYGIYATMYYPQLEAVEGSLSWRQKMYWRVILFKQGIKNIIERYLPEPEAGLATAILLGYRRTVTKDDLAIFSRVGLSHLIAISGSHITVLVALLLNFLLFLGSNRRQAVVTILLFLLFYPVFTGLSASAVRSAIMGGLTFLALSWGRARAMSRALVLAAALMLMVNPRLLRDDVGFQLSFISLLGLVYIQPIIKAGFVFIFGRLSSWSVGKIVLETISLTLAAQLAILPISLITFKQISLVAPLANILALWTFAPLLALLVAAVAVSAIFPEAGLICFFPVYLLLKFIFLVSEVLASPNWAAREVQGFTWLLGFIYYLGLIIGIVWWRAKYRKRLTKNPSRQGRVF
jgi:competence protein ComEC